MNEGRRCQEEAKIQVQEPRQDGNENDKKKATTCTTSTSKQTLLRPEHKDNARKYVKGLVGPVGLDCN